MKKDLEELELMDDYMFYQVMREPRRLKPLLEYILGIKIVSIRQVEAQKTEKEGYTARGIRLDFMWRTKMESFTTLRHRRAIKKICLNGCAIISP